MSQKEETKESLQQKLETLKLNLNNNAVLSNAGALASMKKRIDAYEERIANFDNEPTEELAEEATVKKEKLKKATVKPIKTPAKKQPAVKVKPASKERTPREAATELSKKEVAELKSKPKIQKILSSDFKRHRVHFELSKVGLSKSEISALTGATASNIGRDLLFYKTGKLTIE